MNSSELLLEATLTDRRREIAALRRTAGRPSAHPEPFPGRFEGPRPALRVVLARTLAHLAFHLDRRSAAAIAVSHPAPLGQR